MSASSGRKYHEEAYLNLKPLKSLKDNFQVDIASCLQEYLKELAGANRDGNVQVDDQTLQRTIHGVESLDLDLLGSGPGSGSGSDLNNHNKTNFINAAILLQNSSTVYSRKVEYLHSLVYESLEALLKASDPNGNSSGAAGKNGNIRTKRGGIVDPDIEEFEAFDPDWNFLVFDEDTVPVDDGTSIDLPKPNASIHSPTNHNLTSASTPRPSIHTPHNNNNLNQTNTRVSLGAGMSITKLDQTLHTVTQNKNSMQSHAAQLLIRNLLDGNQTAASLSMAAAAASNKRGGGGLDPSQAVLRLMNGVCDVSSTGALLLPGTGVDIDLEDDLVGTYMEDAVVMRNVNVNLDTRLENAELMDMTMEGNDVGEDHDQDGAGFAFDGGNDYDDHDDDGDDGDGFVIHSPDDNANPDHITTHAHTGSGNGEALNTIESGTEMQQEKSPWDMLDPHDDSEAKSRPIRVKITYRLPDDCDSPPSSSVTGAMTKKFPKDKKKAVAKAKDAADKGDYSTDLKYTSLAVKEHRRTMLHVEQRLNRRKSSMDVDNDDGDASMNSGSDESKEGRHTPEMAPLSMKALAFSDEFMYIAKAQAKYRAAEKRKMKRLQSEKRHESQNAVIANERFEDIYEDNDDDEEGAGFDLLAGADDDYSAGGGGNYESNDGLDGFGGVFGNKAEGDYNRDTHGHGDDQQTFEELCRAHLKEFAKGAEKFAVETHMSKKVSNWQERLEVILAEEDSRQQFDINKYESRVIDRAEQNLRKTKSSSLGKPQNSVPFLSITKDEEPYEVCRTFLASLMLCNSENVTFSGTNTEDVSNPKDLHLKVLKKNTQSAMKNYLAPSVASALAQTDAIMT